MTEGRWILVQTTNIENNVKTVMLLSNKSYYRSLQVF